MTDVSDTVKNEIEAEEISVATLTIKKLIQNGIQRFRRGARPENGFAFKQFAIANFAFREGFDMACDTRTNTLWVHAHSMQCLLDTGSVYCKMGKRLYKFVLSDFKSNKQENMVTEQIYATE